MKLSNSFKLVGTLLVILAVVFSFGMRFAFAAAPPAVNPQSGSVGLEGTIPSPPPTQAATITIPSSGKTFTTTPITVAGLCKTGLVVKVFSNNVFVGSVQCLNGSYSIQVDLFNGQNDLIVRVYDALDQAGPDSNQVTVFFNDGQFAQFGSRVSLTSNYAKRGATPGDTLTWPLILSGGTGPYALSVDWGDDTATSLKSVTFAGTIDVQHIYQQAGIYNVVVKATDKNGTSAFLQLIGVGNGEAAQSVKGGSTNTSSSKSTILWQPAAAMIPLLLATFWLGRRHELFTIRKHLEQSRNELE